MGLGARSVVIIFIGEPLCEEVPVRVLMVFFGNVTSFWSMFVLGGGGGNVTFRGIRGSAGTLYTLLPPLYLRALVRCDVVCCQGILVFHVRGLPARPCRGLA